MNIVFDLGGVVVTWEPEAIIAQVFADPMVQALVHTEIFRHADWLALDRGTLPWQEAVKRGAHRTGLSEAEVATLLQQVPPSFVATTGLPSAMHSIIALEIPSPCTRLSVTRTPTVKRLAMLSTSFRRPKNLMRAEYSSGTLSRSCSNNSPPPTARNVTSCRR